MPDEKPALNRRDFLKSSALGAGAAVTLTGCGRKEESLIPMLLPEDNIIPGTDKWVPGTCALCPAGCGILVRTMQGEAVVVRDGKAFRQLSAQAKKIEGNPRHPINRGATCALGQAAPQVLYNPDRIRTPLRRIGARGSGAYQAISWDEALDLVDSNISPLRLSASTPGLAAIAGWSSHARVRLLQEFLSALGSRMLYRMEPPGFAALREANRRIYARPQLEWHDLENAHYLISFGADILESHTSPVRYSRGLAHFRRGRNLRGKFVQVGSRFSLTAANADEWLAARPGTEGRVALAMAHVILRDGLFHNQSDRIRSRGFDEFRSWVIDEFPPGKIATEADIPADRIERLAREFAQNQPGIALAGGAAVAQVDGVFAAAAVQSLNVLVGNPGLEGGISFPDTPGVVEAPGSSESVYWGDQFIRDAGSIAALILWDANPLYDTPGSLNLAQAVDRIPFVVAFSTMKDETSVHADLILPDRTFLERHDVSSPAVASEGRVLSASQPAVHPMYESRDRAEVLLELSAKWGDRKALPDEDFVSYLKRSLAGARVFEHGSFIGKEIDGFWGTLLDVGVWVDTAPRKESIAADLAAVRALGLGRTVVPQPGGLYLLPFATVGLRDGVGAALPWMEELPDPMSSVVWGDWVEINPGTARRFGIRDGEWVWLVSEAGRIRLPALLTPAARPDTVCVPFGHGHGFSGRYAAGRGANIRQILSPARVAGVGEPAWAATRVELVSTSEKATLVRLGHDRGGESG